MASLHYLTVQDILWINLQVTKKVETFNYARLEEATFYQYAYGESHSLFPQAARFVSGFVKMAPFERGNEATALLAVLAFMGINGYRAKSSPGEITQWFARVSGSKPGTDAIAEIAIPDEDAHHGQNPDVRLVVNNLLANYATSIETLGSSAVAG